MKAISLHSNVGKPKTKKVCVNVNIKHVDTYVCRDVSVIFMFSVYNEQQPYSR